MNRYRKLLTGFAAVGALGTMLGALTRLCIHVWMAGPFSALFYGFGLISTGLLFPAFLCAVLSLNARNGLHASLLTLCLFTPMLMSYYAVSSLRGGYDAPGAVQFWALLLLPAAAGAWILRAFRHVKWFRMLIVGGAVLLFLIDLIYVADGSRRAELAELMLLAGLMAVLFTADREPKESRYRAVQFRYRQQTEI